MITKLSIKNFKAIKDLTLSFTPFTVLIGENSSGKSTVLQALDLLCSITSRDIDEYLKDRDWDFNELKSQLARSDEAISFSTDFNIDGTKLNWSISINKKLNNWHIEESIVNTETQTCYLSYGKDRVDIPYLFSQLKVYSSALKMLNVDANSLEGIKYDRILVKLKTLLTSSSSFELLSPDKMRSRGSRGKVNNIGMGGEKLAAFIHAMPPSKRSDLNKMVSEFIGYDVKISTTTRGQPGWVDMTLEETWGNCSVRVKKRYISDGLLRMTALAAILVNQENKRTNLLPLTDERMPKGFILLDEIEDGIHPSLAEKLIGRFSAVTKESKQQIVVTSHSPIMVNFVEQDNIHFMWRDNSGMIHAKPLFQTGQMKEALKFLNPGEAWLLYSKDEIINSLSYLQED